MRSIPWVVDGRVVEPGRLYPVPGGMAEPAPVRCHQGHPFGPNNGTTGWEPCQCGGHRTHTCAICKDIVQWPEHGPECVDGTFDGRGTHHNQSGG